MPVSYLASVAYPARMHPDLNGAVALLRTLRSDHDLTTDLCVRLQLLGGKVHYTQRLCTSPYRLALRCGQLLPTLLFLLANELVQ
jgi:hypothetical protein